MSIIASFKSISRNYSLNELLLTSLELNVKVLGLIGFNFYLNSALRFLLIFILKSEILTQNFTFLLGFKNKCRQFYRQRFYLRPL